MIATLLQRDLAFHLPSPNSPNLSVKEVDQTVASWNQVTSWLGAMEALS
jgi:hypothetical protein